MPKEHGYGVVRDLCGHGIGTHLHEAPEIPNFRMNRKGMLLKAGMTLAIEPMITAGGHEVDWLDDDWTVVTRDGSLAAHYENTVLITEGEPKLLSLSEEGIIIEENDLTVRFEFNIMIREKLKYRRDRYGTV